MLQRECTYQPKEVFFKLLITESLIDEVSVWQGTVLVLQSHANVWRQFAGRGGGGGGRGGGRGPMAPARAVDEGTSARPGRRVLLQTIEQYQKAIAEYETTYSDDIKVHHLHTPSTCQNASPNFAASVALMMPEGSEGWGFSDPPSPVGHLS